MATGEPISFDEMTDVLYKIIDGKHTKENFAKLKGTPYENYFGGEYIAHLKRRHKNAYHERVIYGVYYDKITWSILRVLFNGGKIIPYEKPWFESMPYQRRALFAELKAIAKEKKRKQVTTMIRKLHPYYEF